MKKRQKKESRIESKKEERDKKIEEIKQEIKKEVLFNIPNTLTLIRLIFGFFIVYMLFLGYSRLSITVVFAIGALTDLFDGMLARKLKQTTAIGARLDQVIDRIFMITIIIALCVYFIMYHHGGVIFLLMLMSREIIGLPGVLIRIIRNKDTYKVKYIGKLTTFVQSIAVGLLILGVDWIFYPAIITSLIGAVSGFDYLKDSLS